MAEQNSTAPQPAAASIPFLTIPQPIPFLRTDEEQIAKIRRQLEGVFRELDLVHDVIVVCDVASHGTVSLATHGDVDLSEAVPHVIRRCATNRLYTTMKTLTEVIERFGGRTKLSENKEGAA